jgi:hypothetical protein
MELEPPIAFTTHVEPPALEIRVNFGVFAGREATAAELEELAQALLPAVGEVSVVSEQRHEVSEESEGVVHQVLIDVAADRLPEHPSDREQLAAHLVELAEGWARACVEARSIEDVSL